MGGFQDFTNSILRNNKNLRGPRSKMNDAHLDLPKSKKEFKLVDKKMSPEEFSNFKERLRIERKSELIKSFIIGGIILTILVILAFIVF